MTDEIQMKYYSAALDEIYRLRRALAYEARVVEAQTLDVQALGKNRRAHIKESVDRMRKSVQGHAEAVYAGLDRSSLRMALEQTRGTSLLTRAMWEDEVDDV
jgi:hypothetical protein